MSIEFLKARLEDSNLTDAQRKLIKKIIADIKKWMSWAGLKATLK